jgi:hypothetical protein
MASVMNLIHETPIYHRVLERLKLNRKPMSCIMCSTFWVTFGFTLLSNPSQSIFIAGITAIVAEIINIQIHKL